MGSHDTGRVIGSVTIENCGVLSRTTASSSRGSQPDEELDETGRTLDRIMR